MKKSRTWSPAISWISAKSPILKPCWPSKLFRASTWSTCSRSARHRFRPESLFDTSLGAAYNLPLASYHTHRDAQVLRRDILLTAYIPGFLIAVVQGILTPTLPLYVQSLGASFAAVGFAVAAASIGTLLGDVPAGMLLAHVGQRRSLLLGTSLLAAATLALPLANTLALLVLLSFVSGMGMAVWGVSRHAYMTRISQTGDRGRTMAIFGGIGRLGLVIGPALGGTVAVTWGAHMAFLLAGILAALTAVVLALFTPNEIVDPALLLQHPLRKMWLVLREHHTNLGVAGSAQICGQMIRTGRQLAVPLYGAHIGLAVDAIGYIISISSILEMVMFIPAGLLMDRFGRRFASVPCFIILSLGMALMPFTSDLTGLLIACLIMGLGNGLGSGTMLTLGADLAPRAHMGEFLGIWSLIGDTGAGAGPLVVGSLADLVGLATSTFVLAGVGFLAAALLGVVVPETHRPRAQKAT
ncbi:MAG: MFS transporter [Chloroflexi bacterium]|nr:MFS transporter [Chloroflexota bacterium]